MPVIIQNNPNGTIQTFSGLYAINVPIWWLPGGVLPANVIAAYQFKGAGSEAGALLNLNNISTNSLTKSGSISWNQATGFYFTADNNGLQNSNIVSNYNDIKTVIVRFSNRTANKSRGFICANNTRMLGFFNNSNLSIQAATTVISYGNTTLTSGVVAYDFANWLMYLNGVNIAQTGTGGFNSATSNMLIGGNFSGYPSESTCYIQAVAFYNTILTPAQIVELTISMQNL